MNLLSQESIPVILFLLLTTMIAYALFPICLSLLRKKAITVGRYDLLCYIFNFFVHFMFYMDGSKSQSGPYMLWTCVFTIIGCKILKKRGILQSRLGDKQSSAKVSDTRDSDICKDFNKEVQVYDNIKNVSTIESCENHTGKRMLSRKKILFICVVAILIIFSTVLLIFNLSNNSFSDDSKAIEEKAKSIVLLNCYNKDGELCSSGSGFLLFEQGLIVTNYHVIEDSVYKIEANTEYGEKN